MAKKHEVIIDKDKCVGCGLCAMDCVSGVISVKKNQAAWKKTGCIHCGHCEAICPQNAISITGFTDEPEEYEEQTRLDPQELLQAIKTRRSIRVFKNQKVSEEIVDIIIEAGRLAPTGGNSQGTSYVVLGSKQAELEAKAVAMFGRIKKLGGLLIPFLRKMEINENFFFKGAPAVIVIFGSSVNASLAAENMAFMAEANGLGVLFSGFFTMCVNRSKKIRKMMGIKKKEKAVTTLVIGYPAVDYHRTVRRKDAKVTKL